MRFGPGGRFGYRCGNGIDPAITGEPPEEQVFELQ